MRSLGLTSSQIFRLIFLGKKTYISTRHGTRNTMVLNKFHSFLSSKHVCKTMITLLSVLTKSNVFCLACPGWVKMWQKLVKSDMVGFRTSQGGGGLLLPVYHRRQVETGWRLPSRQPIDWMLCDVTNASAIHDRSLWRHTKPDGLAVHASCINYGAFLEDLMFPHDTEGVNGDDIMKSCSAGIKLGTGPIPVDDILPDSSV